MSAALHGNKETVALLLSRGADITIKDKVCHFGSVTMGNYSIYRHTRFRLLFSNY